MFFDSQMNALLSMDLLRCLSQGNMTLLQFNAIQDILIRLNIPYAVEFTSGTRKDTPQIVLNIYINPVTSIVFTIDLGQGGNGQASSSV